MEMSWSLTLGEIEWLLIENADRWDGLVACGDTKRLVWDGH